VHAIGRRLMLIARRRRDRAASTCTVHAVQYRMRMRVPRVLTKNVRILTYAYQHINVSYVIDRRQVSTTTSGFPVRSVRIQVITLAYKQNPFILQIPLSCRTAFLVSCRYPA
jgi:hypothetical protein